MQHLINLSLAEMRYDEHRHETAKINANSWQSAQLRRSYRERLATALVALAARLAPPAPTHDERSRTVVRQVAGS